MKKIFILFLTIFIFASSSYAFNISGTNGNQRNYFSLNDPIVNITTSLNASNFSVNYYLNSKNETQILNFSNCSNNTKCASFSLINFFTQTNNSFSGSTLFNIKVGNKTQKIYLDTQKPVFNFISYHINPTSRNLTLNFSASDNYNVSKINLFQKEGSNLIFLKNLTNLTSDQIPINKTGNLNLVFKVTDVAGNILDYEKTINITDIFPPEILSHLITLENGNYKFNFKIYDNDLKKYEIIQNATVLSQGINGTNFSKSIQLPFTSGKILFKVFDNNSNSANLTLSLTNPLTYSFPNQFSNQKTFSFNSNANACELLNIDSSSINKNFTKSSNRFSFDLPVNQLKNYVLKISCQNSNFKQIFTRNFYYDTQKPKALNLSLNKENDGSLKLNWSASYDNQSAVTYEIFKNSNEIYSGTDLSYTDSKVEYPNSYTYYIRVMDKAGNYRDSNSLSMIPKKVRVTFTTPNLVSGQVVNQSSFDLKIDTDKNSTIMINHYFNGQDIFSKTVQNNNSNMIDFNLQLKNGTNYVKIKITDAFGNTKSQNYSIIYSNPLSTLSNQQTPTKNATVTITPVVNTSPTQVQKITPPSTQNQTNATTTNQNSNSSSNWFWGIFWLIILMIFIYIFIIKEPRLKEKFSSSKKRKKEQNFFHKKRSSDSKLEKSLDNIKMVRAKREEEIKRMEKKEAEKRKRELSDFEKKKFEDLKNREPKKEIYFSINEREKAKKRIDKLKKKNNYDDSLKEIPPKETFNQYFKRKIKEFAGIHPEKDEFSSYIEKKRNENSWANTKDYLMSTKLEKDRIEQEKRNEIESRRLEKERLKQEKYLEKEKAIEEKERKRLEKEKLKYEKYQAKQSLDDYLGKRTKKRRFFFAERDVDRDIKGRKKD